MKPTVKLLVSFALSLLPLCSTQECKSHRLRGVRIQLASGPRNITVSLEKNHQLDVTLGDKNRKSFTNEARKCHTINIKEKGRPCRVSSRALDFNVSCEAEGNYMSFGSFNGDFREVASDFALPCEDLPQDSACRNPEGARGTPSPGVAPAAAEPTLGGAPGTPSPGVAPAAAEPTLGGARGTPSPGVVPPKSPPTKPPWNVLAIVGAVALVVIAVVLVVVKVRKSRSSRQAAITADYLHDPGREDDRNDDHDYCYIDLAVVNAQLEHDGETTSLRSHDSENSLYGTGP